MATTSHSSNIPVGWTSFDNGKGLSFRSAPRSQQLEMDFEPVISDPVQLELNFGDRKSIDDATPAEWDQAAKRVYNR